MSTLSGTASKGEKTKPKFQSLDINSLYKISRGENTDKPAQKSSSIYIKHGMQSLGKVPNTRRAPANLPSLKSEHNESGATVPLVPPGATGWGKQEQGGAQSPSVQQNGAATPQSQNTPPAGAPQGPPQLTPHQQAIAIPSTNAIPQHNKQTAATAPVAGSSGGDKLWSAVMAGGQPEGGAHPPAYQSPRFQHEFPSLSAGDGVAAAPSQRAASEGGAPSAGQTGLSLRPQTEGSWTQGGQRAPDGTVRVNSGLPGAPPQLSGPAGRQPELLPPQVRGVLPPFMCKGSSFPPGAPPPQGTAPRRASDSRPPRLHDRDVLPEDMAPRPIIPEEELSKLDEIGHDMGWATSDDVDYNQKLAFSDDEGDRPSAKKEYKPAPLQGKQERQTPPRHWNTAPRSDNYRSRQSEEDDIMAQKQRQHQKEVDIAVQRAKQRKEEEERRFNEENRQRAQKKLQELDEKVREKRDKESEIAKPIVANHADNIPLPDFQKDKEAPKEDGSNFRQLTQIEGKSYQSAPRKPQITTKIDRDHRDQNGPSFSRQFQNDMPPRFLRHQQRGGGAAPQSQPPPMHYETNRWGGANAPRAPSRGAARSDSPQEDDRRNRDYKRQSSEDSYRSNSSAHHYQHDEQPKWSSRQLEKKPNQQQQDLVTERHHYEDRRSLEKVVHPERFEMLPPQRPDSRDSHTSSHGSQSGSRRSREAESMRSWNEDVETAYEEKQDRKDERRPIPSLVPGPITRDRIEAEDTINESRNLTQLKKGGEMLIPLKKTHHETAKKDDKPQSNEKLVWAESVPSAEEIEPPKKEVAAPVDPKKSPQNDYKNRTNRNMNLQNKNWGTTSNEYHARGSWGKRPQSRGHKPAGRDFYGHATDSDGSTDAYSVDSKDHRKPPHIDKDDKNRENKQERAGQRHHHQEKKDGEGYVPRGEPSRHGRGGGGGGGNFRGGSRMGGLGKRIDGYGPPPSKSPFGHHEEKDRRAEDTSSDNQTGPTDKTKQNQEALAAGIIGKSRQADDKNKLQKSKRNKSKSRRDDGERETNSEHSDGKEGAASRRQLLTRSSSQRSSAPPGPKRNDRINSNSNSSARLGDGKRSVNPATGAFEFGNAAASKKLTEGKQDTQNLLTSAINDAPLKSKEENDKEDKKDVPNDQNGDSEGFQEVKSKKTSSKDKPKGEESRKSSSASRNDPSSKEGGKTDIKKPGGVGPPSKPLSAQQMTAQQIQNIPPLMATPVNPPQVLPQPKSSYDQRSTRQNKLAPRFAKQKMQKQMQQQMMNDVGDIKVPQSAHNYGLKENTQTAPPPVTGCAWDKPLGSQLRATEHEAGNMLAVAMESVSLDNPASSPGHGVGSGSDKVVIVLGNQSQIADKNLLDGSTAPVNTIIFENTNFKSAPGARGSSRTPTSVDKARSKVEDQLDASSMFGKPINDLLQKSGSDNTVKPDQIQLTVFKEESDMKLDFLDTDLTHLGDEKTAKNLCISKSITSVTSTICNADSLNMKIASVKKVWETSEQETEDTSGLSFGGPVLDNVFKGNDSQDNSHEGYSPGNNQSASTTNVCKVKPTQQVSSAPGQTVSSASQPPHSALVGHPMLLSTPMSPPPLTAPPVGVSLGPQPFATNQHLAGYQAATGQGVAAAGSQYGISAIPSPPTVLYNSTPSAGLYGAFLPTADQGVLGGQGHARAGGFGQYAAAGAYHGLGQAASSPYNTQSVYLPTAPHPPPTAQAPPELYPSMNSFRLSAATPFGQSQPLSNPTTVLISTTSNSLMSASVKPSSQPISAIGTKAGGVGQAYQQQSQQGQQVYMAYEPALQAANYLQGAGVMQRGPAGPPVQNSVVPGLQPSSSYYSGSTGGQTGYYQQPGSSSLPSAQLSQHQAGYGLQGNVFGTHNQSNTGLQSYQGFLSTQMQVAAALTAQQFRSAGMPNPYLKGANQQVTGDQQGQGSVGQRPQQLKSPSSQEVLSSVFSTAPQIPSPKSKQNNKHIPQQASPTSQRKYNFYGCMGVQQNNMQQRYPPPIQRPVNFQQNNMGSVQNCGSHIQKHNNRNNPNKAPNRQYYGGQSNSLSTNQNDKSEDPKATDSNQVKSAVSSELSKDNIKDEAPALKD